MKNPTCWFITSAKGTRNVSLAWTIAVPNTRRLAASDATSVEP